MSEKSKIRLLCAIIAAISSIVIAIIDFTHEEPSKSDVTNQNQQSNHEKGNVYLENNISINTDDSYIAKDSTTKKPDIENNINIDIKNNENTKNIAEDELSIKNNTNIENTIEPEQNKIIEDELSIKNNTNTENTIEPEHNKIIEDDNESNDSYMDNSRHEYEIINESMNWNEAKIYCENLGGHLATITSQEEQDYINGIIKENAPKRSLWIGLTDEENEGTWKWVTNEEYNYCNWATNEPNNGYGDTEHYVAIVSYDTYFDYEILLGEWNDHSLERDLQNFGFICEWE